METTRYAARFGKEAAKGGAKINVAIKKTCSFTHLSTLRELYQAILIIIRVVLTIEELFVVMEGLSPLSVSQHGDRKHFGTNRN